MTRPARHPKRRAALGLCAAGAPLDQGGLPRFSFKPRPTDPATLSVLSGPAGIVAIKTEKR